uniref:C-type lectin domain-containing protein n=1 Tax=Podarcis muralis TaxID=64176 RepID=A0A670ISK3_PODMU
LTLDWEPPRVAGETQPDGWGINKLLLLLLLLLLFSYEMPDFEMYFLFLCLLPTALPSPSTPTEYCPDGWIGNWTYSQNYCASFDAFLVMIDSEEEMSFLRRYKGPADHWIGLQRMDNQEPWKWINDTIFNNWACVEPIPSQPAVLLNSHPSWGQPLGKGKQVLWTSLDGGLTDH